ncbi:hypothetical protein SKAU_G00111440 [Synaphobranchus kaupii]|uniref:Uncharacterized protein n=1 Tax=Synaphobranchus kaupii TaxID=118154 RepID=A0A9Q1J8D3_SYNKA|nr:hypothetical protein SKAU_G00111440 [Synaphobranchus kaupii]
MVKEVTNPPFLGHSLPPAFALLRVISGRAKRRGSRVEIQSLKSKCWLDFVVCHFSTKNALLISEQSERSGTGLDIGQRNLSQTAA